MRSTLIAAGAAVLAAGALLFQVLGPRASVGAAQTIPPEPGGTNQTGIRVVGEGLVTAAPTMAQLRLGVDVFDASLAQAQQEAARRMDAVIGRLRARGIAAEDIQTVQYSVFPEYDQRGGAAPVLRGYRVVNVVQVRIRQLDQVGAVIDDVVATGATRVEGISFQAENLTELKRQARELAMQNARAKAEQLAQLGGVGLGRVILIEESDVGGVTPVAARDLAVAPAAQPTPIEPGQLEIRTIVRVVYAIS